MPALPLALDIADAVSTTKKRRSTLDLKEKSEQLLSAHPEAEVTLSELEDALREEAAAAGVEERTANQHGPNFKETLPRIDQSRQ